VDNSIRERPGDRPGAVGRSSAVGELVRPRLGGLWRHADFRRLWLGETVSAFGSQITVLALPLAAVIALHATAAEMGFLTAAQRLPFLVFGLAAGVWVDRRRRRPLMIAADLGRAVVLALVPLAALCGLLRMELLYAVAFLTGALTLVFDVAYVAYLPSLVPRDRLVEGNSKLAASDAAAQAAGPGIAGLLVGLVTAPIAVAADAASFAVSAVCLLRIQAQEPAPPRRPAGWLHTRRDVAEGLRAVFGDPMLRGITGCGVTTSFAGYAFLAIYVLYMARHLGLSAATIGLVLASGGVGSLGGALLADRTRRRFGIGPATIVAQAVFSVGGLPVPLAILVPHVAVPMLVASEAIQWGALAVYDINALTLRQTIVPDRLQGRATATMRVLTTGSAALGGLGGGVLGERLGLGPTLFVSVIGMGLAVLWVARPAIWRLREPPAHDGTAGLEPVVSTALDAG